MTRFWKRTNVTPDSGSGWRRPGEPACGFMSPALPSGNRYRCERARGHLNGHCCDHVSWSDGEKIEAARNQPRPIT